MVLWQVLHNNMTAAEKRLLKYVSEPIKYDVSNVGSDRIDTYYEVFEVGKGIIDTIQCRTVDNAILKGIITQEQLNATHEL